MITNRYWAILAILFVATATLYMRADVDKVPLSRPLEELPRSMNRMQSVEIPIDQGTLNLLGQGYFLNRVYSPAEGAPSLLPVGLFIAYFPTQRTGQAIHSPQNCLPGAGWSFLSEKDIQVPGLRGNVGEYVITNGTDQQLVLYWYRAHGRSIANDYLAKLYMMTDAMRYNRTDGALIRIITPMRNRDDQTAAHARAVSFASQLAPQLSEYIPD